MNYIKKLFQDFNFENKLWLFGIAILPLIWFLSFFYQARVKKLNKKKLESFVDKHLIEYILLENNNQKNNNKSPKLLQKILFFWSILWILLMLAMAGPYFRYKEIDIFQKDQNLIILLDLSKSMEAEDIKPSRIVKAKHEIEDLLQNAKSVKMGLIAFAADAHIINPLTYDVKAVKHLLRSIDTDIVSVQGSRLLPALDMAERLLRVEKELGDVNNNINILPNNAKIKSNNSILIISDGGFEDNPSDILEKVKTLANAGINISTIAVGTKEGAPIKDNKNNFIKKRGDIIFSKLDVNELREISKAGNGLSLIASYKSKNSDILLNELSASSQSQRQDSKIKYPDEKFFIFLFPVIILLCFCFRKGFYISILLLFLSLEAKSMEQGNDISLEEDKLNNFTIVDYFKNDEQLGKKALDIGDYEKAIEKFKDPYRLAIAHYKAGNFAEAEKLFRQSTRKDIAHNAAYNLGNALVMQKKYDEAIKEYEKLLEQNISYLHDKVTNNLEIAKKLKEKQKNKEDKQNNNENSKDKNNQNNNEENNKQQEKNNQENDKDRKEKQQKPNNNQDKNNNQNTEQKNSSNDEDSKNEKDKKPEQDKQQNDVNNDNKQNGDNNNNSTSQKENKENQEDREDKKQSGRDESKNNNQSEGNNKNENMGNDSPKIDQDKEDNKQDDNKSEPDFDENSQDSNKLDQKQINSNTENNQAEQDLTGKENNSEEYEFNDLMNNITHDPKNFLKNQFYIESKKNGIKEGTKPW